MTSRPANPGDTLELVVSRADGSFKWSQALHVLGWHDTALIGEFRAGDVVVETNQTLTQPSPTLAVFWTDRWVNVYYNSEPMFGRVWYCNVATPPRFDGSRISYTDLELDVAVTLVGEVEVLDEDEFVTNVVEGGYSDDAIANARCGLNFALDAIQRRAFPFIVDDLTRLYRSYDLPAWRQP